MKFFYITCRTEVIRYRLALEEASESRERKTNFHIESLFRVNNDFYLSCFPKGLIEFEEIREDIWNDTLENSLSARQTWISISSV